MKLKKANTKVRLQTTAIKGFKSNFKIIFMFQPDDKINPVPQDTNAKANNSDDLNKIDSNVSPKKVAAHKNQIEKIFVKLIIFGLITGAILSVGAYYLLNKFGLTKKPYEIERERIERQSPSLEEIRTVPDTPQPPLKI